jgi:hypothetical protein
MNRRSRSSEAAPMRRGEKASAWRHAMDEMWHMRRAAKMGILEMEEGGRCQYSR